MTNNPITPKQQRFVAEYLIDLNATQAAIRAGYSPNTASVQSSRLLTKAKICEAIKIAIEERAIETKIDSAWVLKNAAEMFTKCKDEDDNSNALKALDLCGKHNQVKAFADEAAPTASAPQIIINVPSNPDA